MTDKILLPRAVGHSSERPVPRCFAVHDQSKPREAVQLQRARNTFLDKAILEIRPNIAKNMKWLMRRNGIANYEGNDNVTVMHSVLRLVAKHFIKLP